MLLAPPLLPLPLAQTPAAPSLEVASVGKTEGHATLVWVPAADDGGELLFELQSGTDPAFQHPEVRYAGPDRATFVSGLQDGSHHFRVRQRAAESVPEWTPWSRTETVEVRSYALAAAWGMFAVGALLVGSIVGFLLVADHRLRRGGEAA